MFSTTARADQLPGTTTQVPNVAISPANPNVSLSSIAVPSTFTPSQVSSPLDKFYYGLIQDFPSSFGGWTIGAGGSFTIFEVGSNPTIEAAAQSRFNALPQALHVVVSSSLLKLNFKPVVNPLTELRRVADSISDRLRSGSYGQSVISVGVDENNNRVSVEAPTASGQRDLAPHPTNSVANTTEASLQSEFGSGVLEFGSQSPPVALADRYSDSLPWNGGDMITATNEPHGNKGCTTGPGIHFSNGAHALLTAGHCAFGNTNNDWYNVYYYWPIFTSTQYVGNESTWTVGDAGSNMDFGNILTSSSTLIWSQTATRLQITGSFTPSSGMPICSEGAFGLERCGTVLNNNYTIPAFCVNDWSPCSLEYLSGTIQGNNVAIPGDSGGPEYVPTIFGPLAVGTVVAGDGSTTSAEPVSAEIYVDSIYYGLSAAVNTVYNP